MGYYSVVFMWYLDVKSSNQRSCIQNVFCGKGQMLSYIRVNFFIELGLGEEKNKLEFFVWP